jgi:hypothetical protein
MIASFSVAPNIASSVMCISKTSYYSEVSVFDASLVTRGGGRELLQDPIPQMYSDQGCSLNLFPPPSHFRWRWRFNTVKTRCAGNAPRTAKPPHPIASRFPPLPSSSSNLIRLRFGLAPSAGYFRP